MQIDELPVNIIDEDIEEKSDGEVLPLETPEAPVDSDAAGPSGYSVAPVGVIEWSSLLSSITCWTAMMSNFQE